MDTSGCAARRASTPSGAATRQRKRIRRAPAALRAVTAAVDRGLDENAYIRPGLGDAGDRIFGTDR